MNTIIYCLLTAAVVAIATSLIYNRRQKKITIAISETTKEIRKLEKDSHTKEIFYMDEKKKYISELNLQIQNQIEAARQEGIKIGRKELAHEHQTQLQKIDLENQKKIIEEREEAAKEAAEKKRLELEDQVKLFSIKISPYTKVIKDTGLFYNSHRAEIGYQYQLLVNGIPAFAPHLIIENSEEIKEIDQNKIDTIVEKSVELAKAAAEIYLSGAGKNAVSITNPIIKNIGK